MAYIVINVVFNNNLSVLDRRTGVIEYDLNTTIFGIDPGRNRYGISGNPKKLVTIEKIDESYKIVKFVETIYIDNVKVFDYGDYNCNYCMDNAVCSLDYKYKIEVPKVVFY